MTLQNQLVEWRRMFHCFPEIGWSEFWTTTKIAEQLSSYQFEVLVGIQAIHPDFVRGRDLKVVEKGLQAAKNYGADAKWLERMEGFTGCIGIYDTGRPGPCVALRFDIDCVNVQETDQASHLPNQENFASKNAGLMHACGHDAHIAMGLGVAEWIKNNAQHLKGKIKLFFQPAEEGVRGAAAMAASGQLDDVDFFASSHIGFIAKSGEIILSPTQFLCTTKIDLFFTGKPAHAGSSPHLGRNALAAAASACTQLLGIARHGDGMTRVNIGVLEAGEGRNVIPVNAKLQLEVRGSDKSINQYMVDEVMRIAEGCAISFGVEFKTEIVGEAVNLENDQELVDVLAALAQKNTHINQITTTKLFNGSEDATILADHVQQKGGKAMYFVLGSDIAAGHHQAEFDIDEKQMLTGVELYTGLLTHYLSAK